MPKRLFIVMLQVVVVLVSVWLAWSHATAWAHPTAGRIYGQLVAGAAPARGQTVTLRLYQGSEAVDVLTATTTITGFYQFTNPPPTPTGWAYYTHFGPNESAPAYVNYWSGPDITDYQAGEERDAGVRDIADVKLAAPAPDAVLRLPAVFEWTPRDNGSDVYRVHLFNPASDAEIVLDPVVGQETATLTEADAARLGVAYGARYTWYVDINDPDAPAGFGSSFGASEVTFARHQVYLPLVSANPSPP